MRLLGETLGVEIQVFGPDTHITEIVPLALGASKPKAPAAAVNGLAPPSTNGAAATRATPAVSVVPSRAGSPTPASEPASKAQVIGDLVSFDNAPSTSERPWYRPFDSNTRSLVFGLQSRAIQGMLDFDYACGRATPSVAAMIYPFGGHHVQK